MSDKEIAELFGIITKHYKMYLQKFGVKPVSLRDSSGNYTKDALVLLCLARGYPHTKAVSKAELTEFVRNFYPDVVDVQQARHLSKQKGYNIVSGTRGDISYKIPAGHYKLLDLENPYPAFKPDRREGIESNNFEELKKAYNYKCATCGSMEGKPHNIRSNELTKLQKGHMNPAKPLEFGNIIPQCQVCNRADRDRWIYDKMGRVIEIADSDDGRRVVEKYLKRVGRETKEYFLRFMQKILRKN